MVRTGKEDEHMVYLLSDPVENEDLTKELRNRIRISERKQKNFMLKSMKNKEDIKKIKDQLAAEKESDLLERIQSLTKKAGSYLISFKDLYNFIKNRKEKGEDPFAREGNPRNFEFLTKEEKIRRIIEFQQKKKEKIDEVLKRKDLIYEQKTRDMDDKLKKKTRDFKTQINQTKRAREEINKQIQNLFSFMNFELIMRVIVSIANKGR
jgi:hypothetical protein